MMSLSNLNRLTHSQIIGSIFALSLSVCPLAFAQERAVQEVKRIVRNELTGVLRSSDVDSILDQIQLIPFQQSATASSTTVVREEGTYVFDDFAFDGVSASGTVNFYDNNGALVSTFDVAKLSMPDRNRIDYSITASTPSQDWTEDGVLVGTDDGKAVGLISVDGAKTTSMKVSFGALAEGGQVSISSLTDSSEGSAASTNCPDGPTCLCSGGDGGAASVAGCAIIIVVVVLAVLIFCTFFNC